MSNTKKTTIAPSSLCLALNTVEGRIQFAIGFNSLEVSTDIYNQSCGVNLLASQSISSQGQGAEVLTSALNHSLNLIGATPKAIGKIAIVNGPGSFTGIRLATVSAAAISRATSSPQASINLLELLAKNAAYLLTAPNAPINSSPLTIWVATHARRGVVYLQGFTEKDNTLAPLSKIEVVNASDVQDIIKSSHTPSSNVLLGSGFYANKIEQLTASDTSYMILPPLFNHPQPESLLRAGIKAIASKDDISPEYLRLSDAEENVETFASQLGLDKEDAKARLYDLTHKTPVI